jgi:alkylated DNA repair dioxygenase AlkB
MQRQSLVTDSLDRVLELVRVKEIVNAECYYCPNAFEDVEKECYSTLREQLPWSQGKVRVIGTTFDERRLTCLFSDTPRTYHYSGKQMEAYKWNEIVEAIRDRLLRICESSYPEWENWKFDTCLCNYYRPKEEIPIVLDEDGKEVWKPDMISFHADSEQDLVIDAPIASVSFGVAKRFDLRANTKTVGKHIIAPIQHDDVETVLESGSLFIMGKHTQKYYKHGVSAQKKITGGRINLTFRNTK